MKIIKKSISKNTRIFAEFDLKLDELEEKLSRISPLLSARKCQIRMFPLEDEWQEMDLTP